MKEKLLFILITFLTFNLNLLYAQAKYDKGYIIEDSDTIDCYIKKLSLREIHHKIYIKTNLSDTVEYLYNPADLDGMYIESFGEFVGKKITVRMASDIMQSTDYHAVDNEKFIEKDLFLKVIAGGRANLYLYTDNNLKDHFFIEKDTLFYELYETKTYKYSSDPGNSRDINRYLLVQKKYLGKLTFLLSDCYKVKDKLQTVKLSKSSLTKLINEYNLFFKKDYPVKKISKIKTLIVDPSFFGGLSVNSFHFDGLLYNDVKRFEEPFNNTFTGGVQFNFIFPKFSYDFGITLGLLYAKNNFESSYDTVKYDATYNYDSYYRISYLKYSFLLKYTLNKFKVKPYFFGGLFLNKARSRNSGVKITINDGTTETEDYSPFWDIYAQSLTQARPRSKDDEYGFSVGIGIKKELSRNFSVFIESRYDRGKGFLVSNVMSMSSDYINFVAGIEF